MTRRPYVRPMPRTGWYLRQPRYRTYMLREATCLLVAVYTVLLISALIALASSDPNHWTSWLASQQHVGWIVFHAFALIFFWSFQSVPWFMLAPKAMPLPLARFPAAARLVVAAHYLAWLALSVLVLWLAGVFEA